MPETGAGTGTGTEQGAAGEGAAEAGEPLLRKKDVEEYQERWHEIQSRFVDDPRDSVHAADTLVAEVMQTLATSFSQHKHRLEEQWRRGEEVATEDLRVALRRYRSFFHRLLQS
ncbi:hypothetical protein ABZ547_29335 [Streptomyces sparsogenes]|uniref:hypothetical protein n=1 Tax=Streptomyces sparsogenes TaxID=67365 RepID=UPI0033D6B12F